jgi:hypothetical protein
MKKYFNFLAATALVVAFSNYSIAGSIATDSSRVANAKTTADTATDMATGHGHSGGHGGGGGGAFAGKNVVYVGVGFVGGLSLLGTLYSDEGYSASSIPTITIAYERGLSEHWGVGFIFNYSSVTLNSTGTVDNTYGDYPYNIGQVYSYTDKATLTGLGFGLTGAYHFIAGDKLDPYVGIALGYSSIGFKFTTDDPNASYGDGNQTLNLALSGAMYGGFVGIRYYFTDNIGAWADLGYFGYGGSLINLGLTAKF